MYADSDKLNTPAAVLNWAKRVRRTAPHAQADLDVAAYLAMCVRTDVIGELTYDGRSGWLAHCVTLTDAITRAIVAGATLTQIGDIAYELTLARDTVEGTPRACEIAGRK